MQSAEPTANSVYEETNGWYVSDDMLQSNDRKMDLRNVAS